MFAWCRPASVAAERLGDAPVFVWQVGPVEPFGVGDSFLIYLDQGVLLKFEGTVHTPTTPRKSH